MWYNKEGSWHFIKKPKLGVLINGSGYGFHNQCSMVRGLLKDGGGGTSINSMKNQTIQNFCNYSVLTFEHLHKSVVLLVTIFFGFVLFPY